jgi:hypothetical protein
VGLLVLHRTNPTTAALQSGEDSDRDYDQDIDMYIKQGFDMDPGNEAEEDDAEEEEAQSGDDDSERSEGEEEDGEGSGYSSGDNAGSSEDTEPRRHQSAGDQEASERRHLVSSQTSSSRSPELSRPSAAHSDGTTQSLPAARSPQHSAAVSASTGSSFSPARSAEKRPAQSPPGATTATSSAGRPQSHSTPEKLPVPPPRDSSRNSASITIEAPHSGKRGTSGYKGRPPDLRWRLDVVVQRGGAR